MHRNLNRAWRRLAWVGAMVALALTCLPARADAVTEMEAMVRDSGAAGGICVLVDPQSADLAIAFGKHGAFTVQMLVDDNDDRAACQAAVRERGLYGTVSARPWDGGVLPYTDNLVNIVVVPADLVGREGGVTPAEVRRVLAPLGTLYVTTPDKPDVHGHAVALREDAWENVATLTLGRPCFRARKPWPAEIDEWTHFLHGADGNPVADDTVVAPPEHFQWTGGPLWQRSHETDSSISALVTARGRLFAITDEAPISVAGQHDLPDRWSLVARDAFNGVDLWRVPIRRWGWREWKGSWFNTRPGDIPLNIQKRLVAVGDRVYVTLGYKAPVSELDARTGEILRTFSGTTPTAELLHVGDRLILSVYAEDGVQLKGLDLATGSILWETPATYQGSVTDYIKWKEMNGGTEPPELDPSLNTATDGNIVAFVDGPDVVCVDARTGEQLWRSDFPEADADRGAGGIRAGDNLWIGTMIVHSGVVLHASPSKLVAFDGRSGKTLWERPKRYIGHLWYEWKDVFVIEGLVWTWGGDLVRGEYQFRGKTAHSLYPVHANGYDIRTGELRRQVDLGTIFKANHHHRCYRNKATSRFLLASRRGTEFVDLSGGTHTVHNWVRGTCHVGMMPANGLQYAPPHPCQCYINEKLSGMNALSAAVEGRLAPEFSPPGALRRGPAFGKASGPDAGSADWPVFRADAMRTGSVATTVPEVPEVLWRLDGGRRLTAPTSVNGRVFVASKDDHRVLAVRAADGGIDWTFTAGARVDSPPTYHKGTVLFGSADGRVYCLRAADGAVVWQFRAAPAERWIAAFGQLESAWPVHGSVLVRDGLAYVAAGRTSQLDGGIRVYALRADTGDIVHTRRLLGPDYTAGDFDTNFGLQMGTLPDVMLCDGDAIYMRTAAFAPDLTPKGGKPALVARHGFLDDSYFKRVPWTYGGEYGRLLVHNDNKVFCIRQFDTLRGLDPTVFFTPGANGYLLFAKNMKGGKRSWMQRIRVRIRAMALAGNRLVAAGPPDVVPESDPLGAFENRLGGVLCIIDGASGEKTAEMTLSASPVFNGVAVAGNRLFLTLEDGSLQCFGAR